MQAAASDGSHGERGVIGAFGVNDNDGAVFVISGEGQVDQIDPLVLGLAGGFGRSVSVLGNLLAVGSRPGVINDGTQIEPEVYLYLYDQGNDAWVHQQTISDPRPNTSGSSESSFGIEVQLARDPGAGRGGTSPWADVNLLVSAPGANDAFDQVGVIYSYRPTGSGSASFALHQILRSGTPAPGNYFGAWFDVDQGLLVSTELGADELATSSGVIWAFEAVQQQDGTIDWIRMAKLIDPNAGQNNFSGFVALAGDAALVGSIEALEPHRTQATSACIHPSVAVTGRGRTTATGPIRRIGRRWHRTHRGLRCSPCGPKVNKPWCWMRWR